MFAKVYSSVADTTKSYADLSQAVVSAQQAPDDAAKTGKWFARADFPGSNRSFFFLSMAGYNTQALCETAIETALSPV